MKKQPFYIDVKFKADINELQQKVQQVSGQINKIGATSGGTQVQNHFNALTKSVESLQQRASQPIYSQAEFNKLTQDLSKAESAYQSLIGDVQKLRTASDAKKLELLPPGEQEKIKKADAALKKYKETMAAAGTSSKELQKEQAKLAQQEGIKRTADDEVKKYSDELAKATAKIAELRKEQEKLEGEKGALTAEQRSLQGQKNAAIKKGDTELAEKLATQLEASKAKAEAVRTKLAELKPQIEGAVSAESKFAGLLQDAQTRAHTAAAAIGQIQQRITSLDAGQTQQLKQAFDELKQKAQELGVKVDDLKDASSIGELTKRLQQLKGQGLDQANHAIINTEKQLRSLRTQLDNAGAAAKKAENDFEKFKRKMDEFKSLESQVSYFFGMSNAIQLFRQAIQGAMQSVKELDEVMTEASVVTDFSIGDMWAKLPEYTAQANELGTATKDLYSATTLYYQQGLKTNEAMGVGIETMKMARIASLEAGDATQYMTAALRGFNMEVNETSALRVNDVYSNLAAITASDTGQIATAMSKTASIASAANMEFETTAALLAQIIETTQEAPETAGTALKTIVARFSEVKDLQSKGEKSGKDSEGEDIDVNKIDKALKSVGISMDGFFSGTEGLDSILLKLAEKWDTLDFATQRYIATMAAGSRQQSRFIAMMSDYGRTVELVQAAENSAGASETQFGKTLDSWATATNRLQNAWQDFTMNIADSTLLKEGANLLTTIITGVNELIERISEFANFSKEADDPLKRLVKTVLSLGMAIGALAVGKHVLTGVFARVSLDFEKEKQELSRKASGETDADTNGSVDSETVRNDLTQGGQSAKQSLTEGATEAGEILKNAARAAANTEETSSVAESETEIASAQSASQIQRASTQVNIEAEQMAEIRNQAMKRQGVQEDVMINHQAEAQEAQIELSTAQAEGTTEIATAQAAGLIETSSATAEAGIELAGTETALAIREAGELQTNTAEIVSEQEAGAIEVMNAQTSGATFMRLLLTALAQLQGAAEMVQSMDIQTAHMVRQILTGSGIGMGNPALAQHNVIDLDPSQYSVVSTSGSQATAMIGTNGAPLALPAGQSPAQLPQYSSASTQYFGMGVGQQSAIGSKNITIETKGVEVEQKGTTALARRQKGEIATTAKTNPKRASTSNFMDGDDLGFAPVNADQKLIDRKARKNKILAERAKEKAGLPYDPSVTKGEFIPTQAELDGTATQIYGPQGVAPQGTKAITGSPQKTLAGGTSTTSTAMVPYQKGEMVPYIGGGEGAPPKEPPKTEQPKTEQKQKGSKGGNFMNILMGVMLAITVLTAAVAFFEKKVDKAFSTSAERILALQGAEDDLVDKTQELNQELSEFGSNKQKMKDMARDLGKMSKGSAEWAAQLHEVRTEMQAIYDKYPELREFTYSENGVRMLTEEGWDAYERKLIEDQARMTQSLYSVRQAIQYEKSLVLAEDLYDVEEGKGLKTSSVSQKEEEKAITGTKNYAYLVGAAGTAIGAGVAYAIGSTIGAFLIPGIGAILGAAVGALAGYLISANDIMAGLDPSVVNDVAEKASLATLEREDGTYAFSAVEATDEEINKFVAETGLAGDEAKELATYIKENRQAFDDHTAAVKESMAIMYDYALALGQARAEEKGYTDETAETFARVQASSDVQGYERAKKLVEKEIKDVDVFSKESSRKIAQYKGYVFDEDTDELYSDTNKTQRVKKDEFSEEERREVLKAQLIQEHLNRAADAKFINAVSKGLDYADYAARMSSGSEEKFGEVSLDAHKEIFPRLKEEQGKIIEQYSQYTQDADMLVNFPDRMRGELATEMILSGKSKSGQDLNKELLDKVAGVWEYYIYGKTGSPGDIQPTDFIKANNSNATEISKLVKESSKTEQEIGELWYEYEVDLEAFGQLVEEYLGIDYELLAAGATEGLDSAIASFYHTDYWTNGSFEGHNDQSRQEFLEEQDLRFDFISEIASAEAVKFIDEIDSLKTVKDLGMYEDADVENYDFDRVINNLFTHFTDDKDRTEMINLLLSTDFASLTDWQVFIEAVEDVDGVSEEATEELRKMVNYLDVTGKLLADVDIEELIKKLEQVQNILKKIRDINVGDAATFTKEEYQAMIDAGASEEDFTSTIDGFVYVGDRLDDLTRTLQETNSILLGNQTAALRNEIETAEKLQASTDLSTKYAYQTVDTWNGDKVTEYMGDFARDILGINPEQFKNISEDEVKKRLLETGFADEFDASLVTAYLHDFNYLGKPGKSDTYDNASDSERKLIKEIIGSFGTALASYDSNLENYTTAIQELKLNNLSLMSGTDMFGMVGTQAKGSGVNSEGVYTLDDVEEALDARIEQKGLSVISHGIEQQLPDVNSAENVARVNNAREQAYDTAIEAGEGSKEAKIIAEAAAQAELLKIEQERSVLAKALAVDAKKNQEEIEQLASAMGSYKDVLVEANRETDKYANALGHFKEILEDTYDTDIEIDTQFLIDNAPLVEQLLTGDQGAWDTFTDNLQQHLFNSYEQAYGDLDLGSIFTEFSNLDIGDSFYKAISVEDAVARFGAEFKGGMAVITDEQEAALKAMADTKGYELDVKTAIGWMVSDTMVVSDTAPVGGYDSGPYKIFTGLSGTNTGNKNPFGGGAKKGKSNKWENPYDKFYNTYERINVLLREREKLERRYDKLLKTRDVSSKKLIENSQKELDILKEEREQQEYLKQGKLDEIRDWRKKNSKYDKYVTGYDEATGQITIDWEAINKIKNTKTGEAVEEYISKLEELRDQWKEAQDGIDDIDDKVEEIRDRGRDQFLELEDRLKEALVEKRQKEIDKLSEINDSINDTNAAIIESMQEQIDQYRQNRDNEKTEEEISDKQRRLAYLQQDTSGANATEILNLQKEIEEAQEDYTDTLIDQKISELEEQNDKAAEQRERQIEIMEAQLEHDQKIGAFWDEVHSMINNALNDDGSLSLDSDLVNLLKDIEEYAGMSGMEKDDFIKELIQQYAESISFLELNRAKEGETITFKTADGREVTGIADAAGNIVTDDGTSYSGVRQNMNGEWTTSENYYEAPPEPEKTAWNSSYPMPSSITATLKKGAKSNNENDVMGLQTALKTLGFYSGGIDGSFGKGTKSALENFQKSVLASDWGKEIEDLKKNGILDAATKQAFASHPLYQFKTGGLADFTGPAWLDGTKSRPEYILNAEQTKGFFGLIDVLGSLQHSQSKTAQNNGDNSFDIDINVETIGSDYDVDRLADRVKTLIVDSAYYRNNNTINLMR